MESKVVIPAEGQKIALRNGRLNVSHNPIIPFVEGDGINVDITPVIPKVVDAAVEKTCKGKRKIPWMEVCTGKRPTQVYDQDVWLPAEALDLVRDHHVATKGLLTTPVGGGIHSLNMALCQELDLYVCLRPVHYCQGTPSPIKHPELTDMVILRESSEDVYAGIEWKADSAETDKVIKLLRDEMGMKKVRFPEHRDINIKPCSEEGTKRLVCTAIECVITNDCNSLTLAHKGNIMKFAGGALKNQGYQLAHEEFSGELINGDPQVKIKNPSTGKEVVMKDVIADVFLQQVLLCPAEYDVITHVNLNDDYILDALAAQVGGIGIAPGANISNECAPFETTHGIMPKYASQDKVSPSSIILPAKIMLRHMQWFETIDLIVKGTGGVIAAKTAAYGFERLMEDAKLLECSGFGDVTTADI